MELFDILMLEREYNEIIHDMSLDTNNWDYFFPTQQLKDSCIKQYEEKLKDLQIMKIPHAN